MMQSFASSYDLLPDHIKPCVLYHGLFPVEFEFFPKKLAKLWISEGFIEEIEGKREEDTAKEYLEELTNRWMILREATKRYDGRFKTYSIHNIFWAMCISEAQQFNFFEILDDDVETPSSFSTTARRLAVHITSDWSGSGVSPSVRSILCLPGCTIHLSKVLNKSVHLLRVLHLEGSHIHEKTLPENIGGATHLKYLNVRDTGIESLPSSIGNLVMLGYLNLRDTGIKSLPSSIGNLAMLEFLDLRGNHISPMPTAILKLTRLKELHMDTDTTSMDGESLDVSCLSGLHTLSIRVGGWMKDQLGMLAHLQNFRLYGDLDLCPDAFPEFLLRLTHLQFFRLGVGLGGTIPNLLELILLDTSLRSLELKRSLLDMSPDQAKFPNNLTSNLTYLCLKWSQLKQDPMPILEQLPCLQVLRLRCCSYLGEKMVCNGGGFSNLQILELDMLNELEEWMVEKTAMPVLRRLVISCCIRLKMLPQGLHHLHHLEELEVSGMPKTFNDRLEPMKGEEWNTIQHVKSITVEAAEDEDELITTADGNQEGSTAGSSNPRPVIDAADAGL